MLTTLLHALIWILTPVSDNEADALLKTAPVSSYLTTRDGAREHIAAARAAAVIYGHDAALLLAIAAHESDYKTDARTLELKGAKVSCGLMTPEPMPHAEAARVCPIVTSSPLAGYLDGARHLRTWMRAYPGRAALMAYVGGGAGIRWCAEGDHARTDYRCFTPEWFLGRSAKIGAGLRAARSKDRALEVRADPGSRPAS